MCITGLNNCDNCDIQCMETTKKQKKVLITGIAGFVGSHLAEYCLKQGDKVYGTILSHHLGDELKNLKSILGQIILLECNLRNRSSVFKVINEVQPDIIFHLAAHSFVPISWKDPEEVLTNNILSELNVFETIRDLKINPVILIACSSEEYGLVKSEECPVKESQELRPMSPYAVSKVAQEMLAKQYHYSYGLKTVITRAFNHEGARRSIHFVTSAFASQIAKIEKTGEGKGIIKVGNLNSVRDFTDVRDMVRAYYLAVTSEKINYGEPYNICSGEGHKIGEVLKLLIKNSTSLISVKQDESLNRPSDVPLLIGNSNKFREVTGWKPEIDFQTTLLDVLQFWRGDYIIKTVIKKYCESDGICPNCGSEDTYDNAQFGGRGMICNNCHNYRRFVDK